MYLRANDESYFIISTNTILKCCRTTAKLTILPHSGKITIEDVSYLLLVTECTEIANLSQPEASIWRIDKVCALPILNDGLIHKKLFEEAKYGFEKRLENLANFQAEEFFTLLLFLLAFYLGLSAVESNYSTLPKYLLVLAVSLFFVKVATKPSTVLIGDIVSFINQSKNFYFSPQADITQTFQNRCLKPDKSRCNFVWNRRLLKEFYLEDGTPDPTFKDWITPIILGHIEQKQFIFGENSAAKLTMISRRSTKRAGVRFLRRGIDPNGDVANFVETEFIVFLNGHSLSFTQCRGSVPVFWSQTGLKFRPPLSIDRDLDESFPVFKTHITKLLKSYGQPLIMVDLVDQTGREMCLRDSYQEHVLKLGLSEVTYHPFDFHNKCGSLRLHMVKELVTDLEDQIKKIGFCWMDKAGQMVQRQKGIIRTNCVDCLDRTNVVQSAISQAVCLNQCRKLGLVEPINEAPEALVRLLQSMWADHGDSISRQYAGTNALKGDITRNIGQQKRKLSGFLKDGYSSATRYYLSRFSDAQRQNVIDKILS